MILMRHEIGAVLRDYRLEREMTLRDVSSGAQVSLGYLSELERGQKEASSEVLASIAYALGVSVSQILFETADRLALFEDFVPVAPVPDTIPEEFYVERVHD
jgi:transcriptional regulator with XRE-family HTH domain